MEGAVARAEAAFGRCAVQGKRLLGRQLERCGRYRYRVTVMFLLG
jgi:hypothetical protein